MANLKIIVGSRKSVLPKITKKVALTTTEYNFKKISFCVKKQNSPATKSNAELSKGFQSRTPFSPFAFLEPVALKKKAAARAIIHNDKTLTGNLKITKKVKTRTG